MSALAIVALALAAGWALLVITAANSYLSRIADAQERIADEFEADRAERAELAARFTAGGDDA